jgi:uncharacterized protein YheU (UPF0270 family)
LKIRWQELSVEALNGIIEDFVTREGTEYGTQEVTLDIKVKQVKAQLEENLVVINFDPETQSCSIEPIEG